MRKFLKRSLLFFICFLFAYPLLLCLWWYTGARVFTSNFPFIDGLYDYNRTRLQEVRHTSDVDILILGSSQVYYGYDTRIFEMYGLKAFGLGSSAQTPLQTKVLIQRYLDQLNPKLVIYDVYPVLFTLDGVEAGADLVSADINDKYSWEMVLKINSLKLYNAYLFSCMGEWLGTKKYPEQRVNGETYIPGGFIEADMTLFEPVEYEYSPTYLDIRKMQTKAFEDILNILKEKNVEYVLIFPPVPERHYQSFTNIPEFEGWVDNLGSYYNFNESKQLVDSLHFLDQNHMNPLGAKIFTEQLISLFYPHCK